MIPKEKVQDIIARMHLEKIVSGKLIQSYLQNQKNIQIFEHSFLSKDFLKFETELKI